MAKLLNTVLGTANFGKWDGVFTPPKGTPQEYLDLFKKSGFTDIDTARVYGTSEQTLGELGVEKQGFRVDTKVMSFYPGAHKANALKESVQESLKALETNKVHIMYLHVPDRATPFEETLQAVNEIYQTGAFNRFGVSNHTAEDIDKMVSICQANGYVLPTVYQGCYNAIDRAGEKVLFPVLRKHNISFYAYSPVAGGFFLQKKGVTQPGGRFDNSIGIGTVYNMKYAKDSYYQAVEKLNQYKGPENKIEIAIRWIYHHSLLDSKYGDSVILGMSQTSHLEKALEYAKKGPLSKQLVDLLEEIWKDVEKDAPSYDGMS
eukprot:TRINITY_DN2360_c0_g3_i5.p1 TRINITY_DN2360_c0_g3~~TRINITY_DN2360_c0_g3_i5.p1  ORF type:complete len:318 (-),score=78.12 TRINITY_DN2360_c0_g3_i5:15-968(-)